MRMKVELRGGPKDHDGKEIEVMGGQFVTIAVEYENASYGETCKEFECPDRGKHKVEIWKTIFNRTYEITPCMTIDEKGGKTVKYYTDYRGEK